jgi:hypothetical protein
MPSLIGNKPNQVPSNGDLGTLAFQDASNVKAGSITADTLTVDTNTLVVDSVNDRVGVGTTSPASKLNVVGTTSSTLTTVTTTTGLAAFDIKNTGGTFGMFIDNSDAGGFAKGAYSRNLYSNNNYPLVFWTNDTERMRLTSAGVLELTQGQIKFPATQVASADANTLDDYEEGTWTPSVGGNATYINQLGHYTKIGNFVKLRFHLEINSLGTGSTVAITGIPFNPANNGPSIVGGNVCYAANLATAVLALGVYAQATGFIYFYTRNSSSTGATTQQPAIIGNGANLYCEVSYQV